MAEQQQVKKHIMLSYEWKVQKLALAVYQYLVEKNVAVWMDIKSGVPTKNLYEGLSQAIENSSCFVCFMTQEYQNSDFCKQEFQYAKHCHIPIIPLKLDENWQPSNWLGLLTVGLIWVDFSLTRDLKTKAEELYNRICSTAGSEDQHSKSQQSLTKSATRSVAVEKQKSKSEKSTGKNKNRSKFQCSQGARAEATSLNDVEAEESQPLPYIAHLQIDNTNIIPDYDKSSHPRKPCRYGLACYDNTASHRMQFSHPSGTEENAPTTKQPRTCRYGSSCFDKSDSHRAQFLHPSNIKDESETAKEPKPCWYGATCYDKSPAHRAKFLHPDIQ